MKFEANDSLIRFQGWKADSVLDPDLIKCFWTQTVSPSNVSAGKSERWVHYVGTHVWCEWVRDIDGESKREYAGACVPSGKEEEEKKSHPVALHPPWLQKTNKVWSASSLFSSLSVSPWKRLQAFFCPQECTDDSCASLRAKENKWESPHWILQAPEYLMRQCCDHQGCCPASAAGWGWMWTLATFSVLFWKPGCIQGRYKGELAPIINIYKYAKQVISSH